MLVHKKERSGKGSIHRKIKKTPTLQYKAGVNKNRLALKAYKLKRCEPYGLGGGDKAHPPSFFTIFLECPKVNTQH